jgi:hypothetical protein
MHDNYWKYMEVRGAYLPVWGVGDTFHPVC